MSSAADLADEILAGTTHAKAEVLWQRWTASVTPEESMADMLFAMAVMTANIVTSAKMPPDKALPVLAGYAELVHRLLREKGFDLS